MSDLGDPDDRWSATQMRALENSDGLLAWLVDKEMKNGGVQQRGSEVARRAIVSLLLPLMAFGWHGEFCLRWMQDGTGRELHYPNLIPQIYFWTGRDMMTIF